jgi:ribose-phosphate pyrophosphokinase
MSAGRRSVGDRVGSMLLFVLKHTHALGTAIARELGIQPAPHEEREFEDGEHKARPLVDPRGADCHVVQSLYGAAGVPGAGGNDALMRLLLFCGALRDHGAARVTAVVPYLAYARKDRQTQPFDPLPSRYLAQLIEAMGVGALVTLEAHNLAAFQNAFRIPTLHLSVSELFVERAAALAAGGRLAVASPDPGGVKRAQLFREALQTHCGTEIGSVWLDKRRARGMVSGSLLTGEVRDATVLLLDDLISTGGTLQRAAQACREHGARRVFAFAAHGLFAEGANAALADPQLDGVSVSDSVPLHDRLTPEVRTRLGVVSAAPLLARAIRQLHEGGSGLRF